MAWTREEKNAYYKERYQQQSKERNQSPEILRSFHKHHFQHYLLE